MISYCTILAIVLACSHLARCDHWALLVAGSNGYANYRHQADVAHAYQIVRQHGVPPSNIVTMMYDDIAYNSRNPYKGNIINVPNGPNVYKNIHIDYKGSDVNKNTFINVLQGNYKAVRGVGSGKVILSDQDDHVFVYYADHGNKGFICFPSGGNLYTRELLNAINSMHNQRKYGKMVFYIEACFSGSMFYRRLPNNINVYAITAANERESSWSCYYDRKRKTSLADDFSVKWMQDSEQNNFLSRTLDQQYRAVKSNVRLSHVCQFGDVYGIGNMVIGAFQGNNPSVYSNYSSPVVPVTDLMPSWDVPYMSLLYQLKDAKTVEERMSLLSEMRVEEEAKLKIQESLQSIVGKLVAEPSLLMYPQESEPTEEQDHCYEQAVMKYDESCSQFKQYDYAKKDLHVFANLCNIGERIENIYEAIEEACSA